jgi:hypothetical protein
MYIIDPIYLYVIVVTHSQPAHAHVRCAVVCGFKLKECNQERSDRCVSHYYFRFRGVRREGVLVSEESEDAEGEEGAGAVEVEVEVEVEVDEEEAEPDPEAEVVASTGGRSGCSGTRADLLSLSIS